MIHRVCDIGRIDSHVDFVPVKRTEGYYKIMIDLPAIAKDHLFIECEGPLKLKGLGTTRENAIHDLLHMLKTYRFTGTLVVHRKRGEV